MFDSIVVGGGPAGMSAAIYLVRKKMKTLLISPDFGGQASKSSEIENYLGFESITGPELMQKFSSHAQKIGVESKIGEEVKNIKKIDGGFAVKTGSETYETKSVILTCGKTPRALNVPGEEEYIGKGIGYCAVCDGPLFSGKVVSIIGGGNSALDAALETQKYASKVYILNKDADFQGDEIRKDKVKESEKIEILTQVETTGFFGEQFLKGIKYKDKSGKEVEIATDGAFIEIGWAPATESVKNLVALNPLKEIVVDVENRTNVPGIFAAGDVTNIKEKQIIIAAGEGAKAALNAWQYIVLEHKDK